MAKLEELKAKLEEAKLSEQRARELADNWSDELKDKIKNKWIALLKSLMPVETKIDINMATTSCYITIEMVDDNSKELFGTSIYLHITKRYADYEKRRSANYKPVYELKLNTGSCNEFGKDDYAQIGKYKVISNLIEHFELLENTLTSDFSELNSLMHINIKMSWFIFYFII